MHINAPQAEGLSEDAPVSAALTSRHKLAVNTAIEEVNHAIEELRAGNDEVATMLMRSAYQKISSIEHEHIDEKILDKIFASFCIGK